MPRIQIRADAIGMPHSIFIVENTEVYDENGTR